MLVLGDEEHEDGEGGHVEEEGDHDEHGAALEVEDGGEVEFGGASRRGTREAT